MKSKELFAEITSDLQCSIVMKNSVYAKYKKDRAMRRSINGVRLMHKSENWPRDVQHGNADML